MYGLEAIRRENARAAKEEKEMRKISFSQMMKVLAGNGILVPQKKKRKK